jgi:hypothetical protein
MAGRLNVPNDRRTLAANGPHAHCGPQTSAALRRWRAQPHSVRLGVAGAAPMPFESGENCLPKRVRDSGSNKHRGDETWNQFPAPSVIQNELWLVDRFHCRLIMTN